MFILKNKKGGVVDKTSYDEEKGNIYYNNKKVGTFELNHDSNLGSYYLYIMNIISLIFYYNVLGKDPPYQIRHLVLFLYIF